MNIGDFVAIAEEVGGVLTKVPAIVTKVYENAHGEVIADLHRLESNVHALIVKELNPAEALPPNGGMHVTTDTTPTEETQQNAPAAPVPAVPGAVTPPYIGGSRFPFYSEQASAPDAQLSSVETGFAALSDADKAAFLERYGQPTPEETEPSGGTTEPSAGTPEGGTVGLPGTGTGAPAT